MPKAQPPRAQKRFGRVRPTSQVEGFPVRHHHRHGDGESGDAVSVRRLPDAAFRPRHSDARPAAVGEDAARATDAVVAAVAERRRSDSDSILHRGFRRGDDGDAFPSARPRPAEPRTAAAEDAAVAAVLAAADHRRRVADAADGHRVHARAAVVAVAADARRDVAASLRRGAHPSCQHSFPSAARTPAACAACTCG